LDSPARILVVDDDPGVRSTLSALLWAEGYFVSLAGTLAEAELAAAERPQLVLLDLHLKEGKSYAFGRWLKAQGIPFLMLSGERQSLEKVLTLELGAEDYITKPFDEAEFFARLRVVLRRQGAGQRGAEDLALGPFRLCIERRGLDGAEGFVPLTAQELALLRAFAAQPGQVLSRDALARSTGARPHTASSRHIDVAVGKLRKKLGPGALVAVRGQGYQLTLPVMAPGQA
jgi:DNA-binding response OmpR family regulator